ncbi:Manganese/iron superoxide dismutase [Scheffersomyces amazonensis]|uniref:Manganese/iron superoxide dismutase n=1 Tax=Scheffersomyces amazonensis TaxID=1078765 RepID=UPI00315E00AD
MLRISNSRKVGVSLNSKVGGLSKLSQRYLTYRLSRLPALEAIQSKKSDFKGLFSNKAINEVWFNRGEQLVDGLNQSIEQTFVTDGEHSLPNNLPDLISSTIHKPEFYGVYCYSTLLYNLQFFMENIRPSENSAHKITKADSNSLLASPLTEFNNEPRDELKKWINDSFGSLREFRTLLLNSAKGIKGDGVTWLVAESNISQTAINNGGTKSGRGPQFVNLRVVNTYNTGYVDDSVRSGQVNRLKQQKKVREASLKAKQLEIQEKEQQQQQQQQQQESPSKSEQSIVKQETVEESIDELTLGTIEEAELNVLFNDKKLVPLLAIDASPRTYLLDYGVFGKQNYLDNVWECIDWDVVAQRAPQRTQSIIGDLYL